jgi:4-hydroxybenzoate polyprenyltransferase
MKKKENKLGNSKLIAMIYLLRPHQWLKNLFIFMPLFFSANLTNLNQLTLCLVAFFSFSFVASSIYCMNDAVDVNEDRKHPEKAKRPIASGKVSIQTAAGLAIILLITGISIQLFAGLNTRVTIITLLYLCMNFAYVFKLKQIAIVDVMCIASGFVFRVLIGGYATDIVLSHWIVLMTFLLASFLACAKRRDDVLFHLTKGIIARKNIVNYNVDFLNAMMSITATITIICYIMYTVDKEVIERFHNNHYIYATSVFVLAAVFRYLQIALVQEKSGSPTKILLKDKFIQLCIAGWIIAFVFIIYVV